MTKLEIRLGLTWHIDGFRAVLLQLQNVEELRVEIYPIPQFVIKKCSPVFLARFRHIDVSLPLPVILYWFETPLLEHLEIIDRFNAAYNHEIAEAISSLIYRSSCQIHQLTLGHCTVKVIYMVLRVRELTSAEELNQGDSESLSRIIRDLAKFDERISFFLPTLHVLRLKCCPPHAINEFVAAISNLLEARGKESELVARHRVALESIKTTPCGRAHCHDITCNTTPKCFGKDVELAILR